MILLKLKSGGDSPLDPFLPFFEAPSSNDIHLFARDREHFSERILFKGYGVGCDRLGTGGWLRGRVARWMVNKSVDCLVMLLHDVSQT